MEAALPRPKVGDRFVETKCLRTAVDVAVAADTVVAVVAVVVAVVVVVVVLPLPHRRGCHPKK